jgi:hypothetical protein
VRPSGKVKDEGIDQWYEEVREKKQNRQIQRPKGVAVVKQRTKMGFTALTVHTNSSDKLYWMPVLVKRKRRMSVGVFWKLRRRKR